MQNSHHACIRKGTPHDSVAIDVPEEVNLKSRIKTVIPIINPLISVIKDASLVPFLYSTPNNSTVATGGDNAAATLFMASKTLENLFP